MNRKNLLISFSLLEAFGKTLGGTIQKLVGVSINSTSLGFLSYAIAEGAKTIFAIIGIVITDRKVNFFPNTHLIIYAFLFGLVATLITVGGIYSFQIGAELHTRTLILVATPIAATFLQPFFFKVGIEWHRQIPGLILFLIAAWAMLGYPSDLSLDLWVWVTLIIMILAVFNGIITKKATDVHKRLLEKDPDTPPHSAQVWNFWTGISAVAFSILGFILFGTHIDLTVTLEMFVFFSALLGIGIFLISLSRFLAFQKGHKGATIDFQTFIVNMSYLIMATVVTITFSYLNFEGFDETVAHNHVIGIVVFALAFVFIDKSTYQSVRALIKKEN